MNCGDSSITWMTAAMPSAKLVSRPCRNAFFRLSRSTASSGRRQARLPKPSKNRSRQAASPPAAGSQGSSAGRLAMAAAASFSAAV